MPLRVLIVPDKFKGTLTARSAAESIAAGWKKARPADSLDLLPMSDGGDGFGAIMADLTGAEERILETVDAARLPLKARWWFDPRSGRAIIESAAIVGLALLPPGRFHPYDLDTRGLAAAFRAAWHAGASEILMGIGGSATNDAGFGLARGLGWEFLDDSGRPIERWVELDRVHRWTSPSGFPPCPVTVAVDVENPLLGPQGCSRIYGPQKGLRPEQAPVAEAALGRLASLAAAERGTDLSIEPGAGAAGGLGFGLRTFLGARLESGFGIFARQAQLENRIASADLVITGEGAIDRQTYMGKGTGQVALVCQRLGVRCLGLAGMAEAPLDGSVNAGLFHQVAGITPALTHPAEAKSKPDLWLSRLAEKIAAADPA